MTARMRLQPEAIGLGMTSQRVRDRLIERLRGNGIQDERVLNAIRTVPRHLFVDEALATRAYEDTALPIGHGQTISQPWVVAKMTEALFAGGAQPKNVLGKSGSPLGLLGSLFECRGARGLRSQDRLPPQLGNGMALDLTDALCGDTPDRTDVSELGLTAVDEAVAAANDVGGTLVQ